jgi:hypothetical protein
LERGNEYDKLRNVICIAILDEEIIRDTENRIEKFYIACGI